MEVSNLLYSLYFILYYSHTLNCETEGCSCSLSLRTATKLCKAIWKQAASPPLVADPFRAAIHTVQLYLPGGANVHVNLIHDSLGPPTHHPKWPLNWFSHFCMDDATFILYITFHSSIPRKICPLPGGSGSHLIYGS